ncbi:hypothetical protein HBM99_13920 [Providencia heimbachae]|uniref:hypothetical protein n=1 Tax=Providencia heimbachae TaxID=333962 RepID=UPI001419F2A8|nr:hypothetical protein [Providencia heimbachae]NIH23438.1 hypothetical protein [Providencia heimbachae]
MDKSRQQFEEWFDNGYACSKLDEKLIKAIENVLWDVWQASRESLEVELPTKEPNPSHDNYYAFGYNRAITESIEMLSRQGVKIKNG